MATESTNIVGERFWLNLAAEQIYSSFEKRAASVKSLKEIILWAYGLFTGTGFITAVFKDVSNFPDCSLLLFGLAFFLLTIAYALSNEAQYPVTSSFHPNNTIEIAASYSASIKKQSNYFKFASSITLVGFFLFSLAILLLFNQKAQSRKESGDKTKIPAMIKIGLEKKDSLGTIPITISTEKGKTLQIVIQNDDSSKNTVVDSTFYADSKGNFYASFPIKDKKIKSLNVKVTLKQLDSSNITRYESTVVRLKLN